MSAGTSTRLQPAAPPGGSAEVCSSRGKSLKLPASRPDKRSGSPHPAVFILFIPGFSVHNHSPRLTVYLSADPFGQPEPMQNT